MTLCTYHTPDGRPVRVTFNRNARLPAWRKVKGKHCPTRRHEYEAHALAGSCTRAIVGPVDEAWRTGPNMVIYCDDWPHQVRSIVHIMKNHGWPIAGDPLPGGALHAIPMPAGWYARRHYERTRAMARLILGIPANALLIHQPADEEEAP